MSDRSRRLLLFVLLLCWIPLPALGQLRIPANQMVETWKREWTRTDFTKFSVDLSEIMSGGPPRDGIPPIDNPPKIW